MDNFIIHAFEQVLRFSNVAEWDDLTEQIKVQIGFNMGVIAHGLQLNKEDGFQILSDVREGIISMGTFRKRIISLMESHKIKVDQEKIARPF